MRTRLSMLIPLVLLGCAPAIAQPRSDHPPDRPADRPSDRPPERERPSPRPLKPCEQLGAIVFQIDQLDQGKVVASDKLFATGAWSTTGADASTGCAEQTTVDKLRHLIGSVPWTIEHPIHCEAMSTKSTAYSSGGKPLFTERMCNPDKLDDRSEKVLADLKTMFAQITAPKTATGCRPGGDVLVEIEHGANMRARLSTSILMVYAGGFWGFEAKNPDGSSASSHHGCLNPADKERIERDLQAPFTVTTTRVRCMAKSMSFVKYRVRGNDVFTKQVCGAILDEKSQANLDDIESLFANRTGSQP